jgi:hypothetical protein
MGNLSNLYISQSFPSLAHLGTNAALVPGTMTELQDGIGQSLNISFDGTNISSSGNIFAANITASVINTGSLVSTASFNQYTSSTNIRLNNLETTSASVNVSISNLNAATASYVTETESGSFLLTASFDNGTRNLTFTKGNNTTFNVNIPDVSGSTFNTGSFATTGSNTFTGTNSFSGAIDTIAGISMYQNGLFMGYPKQMGDPFDTNISISTPRIIGQSSSGNNLILAGDTMNNRGVTVLNSLGVTGSVVVSRRQVGMSFVGGDLNLESTFTASLQQGYVWVGDSAGRTVTVATSSFIDTFVSGNLVTTASFNQYTSSNNQRVTALESTSASLLIETQNLELFSASALTSISNLNASSASQQISINSLNSATASYVTETESGSFLITASVSGQTLTFTKGDNTTFGVTLPTGSGGSTDLTSLNAFTASQYVSNSFFATTGSNTFTGEQIISSSLIVTNVIKGTGSIFLQPDLNDTRTLEIYNTSATDTHITASGGNLFLGNDETYVLVTTYGNQKIVTLRGDQGISASGSLDISGSLTASLQTGYVWVGNASGRTVTVATSSFGGGGSTDTGSLMVTGSIAGNILTFTKGDASTFNLTIPSATGSVLDTGSFATTGSNTFTGVNTFNERTNLQGINVYTGSASGIYIGDRTNFAPTTAGNIPGNQHTVVGQGALNSFGNGDLNAAFGPSALYLLISGSSNLAMGAFAGYALVNGNTNIFIGDQAGNGMQGGDNNFFLGSSAGNNFRTGSFNIMIGLNTQGNLATGSGNLFIGYQTGGKIANNVDNQFAVAYGTDLTPRRLLYKSGSEADNLGLYGGLEVENTFTASLAQGFAWVGDSNNRTSLVATSSFGGGGGTGFATTGSNVFTGDQTLIDNSGNFFTISDASGSMMLVAKSYTSASAHLSSSVNQVNLIWKDNNNTADTIISGSGNIFSNPAAPVATFKRYVGGSNNIYTNSGIPSITGSMQFSPSMNRNVGSFAVPIRGPISSSAWTLNDNLVGAGIVNLGTAAASMVSASAGCNFNSNLLMGGTVNITANRNTLDTAVSFNSNIVFGAALNLNHNSSSVNYFSNIQNGGITINNNYTPTAGSTTFRRTVAASINTVYGINHLATIGGTNTSTTAVRNLTANLMAGTYITASLQDTGDNTSMIAVNMMGNALIVSGTSASPLTSPLADATYGSVFSGRFNAVDGNKAKTAETVFAIGTGTSYANRKTGFLIDSGSNTFIEGTLNVSGSTTMTGSLILSSSNAVELTVIGDSQFTGSLSIQSGSAFFANGNRQFNVGAFQSNVTQSGSANVSQSMNFETTDISSGVSIASNSRITLANSGTYNIQFSAQTQATGGADNLYIWLKKNGINVTASAGNVEIINNQEVIAAWNYLVNAAAGDYFELAWQAGNVGTILLAETASGNIPSIPSVILTVTQVR